MTEAGGDKTLRGALRSTHIIDTEGKMARKKAETLVSIAEETRVSAFCNHLHRAHDL